MCFEVEPERQPKDFKTYLPDQPQPQPPADVAGQWLWPEMFRTGVPAYLTSGTHTHVFASGLSLCKVLEEDTRRSLATRSTDERD